MTNQTRITLKNVKHAEFASEETPCYQASVYFDGKRVGTVSNEGHGGCDAEHPTDREAWKEMLAYVATLPDETVELGDGDSFTMQPSLESVCHSLLTQRLIEKDVQNMTRNKVVFFEGDWNGKYRFVPIAKAGTEERARQYVARKFPNATIFNDLPREKQVALLSV